MQAHFPHALHLEVVGSPTDGPTVSHVQTRVALLRLTRPRQTHKGQVQAKRTLLMTLKVHVTSIIINNVTYLCRHLWGKHTFLTVFLNITKNESSKNFRIWKINCGDTLEHHCQLPLSDYSHSKFINFNALC